MSYEMYSTPCRLCGEEEPDKFRIYFDGYMKLFRCCTCGFVSQFPGPGRQTIVAEYEDPDSLDFVTKGQEFMYPERRRVLQDIVDRIVSLKQDGKVLDVGCGDGHFLYLSAQKRFDCYGVEPNPELASYAASKAGADVRTGYYNKDMFQENSLDVITFIQVLEHITSPLSVLETAVYHLKKDGLVVIEVPSIRSPHFLAFQYTGIKWFVKPPTGVLYSHFGYYDPDTLLFLSEKAGFSMSSLTTGRWECKYSGMLKLFGMLADPLFDKLRVGGILYFGIKK